MAVYTEVDDDALQAFIAEYDIGDLESYKGIAEGVENSNFLLTTSRGPYILTLYEKRVNPADLPFFLGLMEHLAGKGLACPTPVAGRDGQSLRQLCGKPAAIVSFLRGMWPRRIQAHHCEQLGRALAEFHLAGADFTLSRRNSLSVAGWQDLAAATAERADSVIPGLRQTIADELAVLSASWPQTLPTGVIHADLFPDNAFFLHDHFSGMIDFYFACNDLLAYDLAICLNAWCFEDERNFNSTKARLMVAGYTSVRPLSADETQALPLLCRGASLRFLLTRLYDWLNTPEGAFVQPKNPREYLRKLQFHASVKGVGDYGLS